MNRFRFFNVGQGLFYSAKMDCDYNFVFDCGTESSNGNFYLKNCIANEFQQGDCLDLFIISHLHKDHINGLDLLKERVEIGNIHVPFIGTDPIFIQAYLALTCIDERGRLDKEFYHQIHGLYLNDDNTVKENYYKVADYWMLDDSARRDQFNSGLCTIKETVKLRNGWEIVFFDRFITEDLEQKLVIQISTCIGNLNVEEYASKFGLLRLQQIFMSALKDREYVDKFATVVLHRPSDDFDNMTLLTGDIVMDETMVEAIKKATLNKLISYFQIPHHGSIENFDAMKELGERGINYYISFGLGNAYKHPTSTVLNKLVEARKSCGLAYQFSAPYFYWNEYYI